MRDMHISHLKQGNCTSHYRNWEGVLIFSFITNREEVVGVKD